MTRAGYVRAPDWPAPVRYGVAVAAALGAAGLRAALSGLWVDDLPFLMFVPAIVLGAWAGGFWPGMVTTVLGAALANYLWLPPYHSLRVTTVADAVGLVSFAVIGALISALSESMVRGRRRLEGLLHRLDEGFLVLDVSWRVRYMNCRAAELLRQPAASIVGTTLWDLFPGVAGTETETRLRRASAASEPAELEAFHRPVGRWFRTRVFSTPEGFSALLEDVTERKQSQEASLRLAAIVRSSEEAIVGKDLDGIITAWNPAAERLFGFTAREAIGRSIRMIVPADRQTEEDEVLSRLRRGEAIEHLETVRIRKDGTPINIALTVSPIRDADGRVIGASKIARDIGARLRAEVELARLLTAEQAARARAESDERRATLLSESSAALSASQLQLIDDLLDVSRIISGKMRLDIRPVEIHRVIEAALDAVRLAAEAKELRLQTLFDPSAGPINGDPDRLQQVVWNLLMNAVKFTPRDGRIQVTLQRVSSHLEIVVSDSGAGIRSELLPVIFDRFKQGESGSTRNQSGLGIGLALVRHLVELHGGSVAAESEGKGATFRVKLPLVDALVPLGDDRAHPTARQPVPAYHGPSLRGLRVLVVDDDPDALDLIATILRRADAEPMLCSSPPEALAAVQSWKPHVLVSDIEMPGEDGYSLIRKIRELAGSQGGQIPAVALTAYGRPEDRVRSLSAGYSMHVAKPVDPVELGVIVANLAGRSLSG